MYRNFSSWERAEYRARMEIIEKFCKENGIIKSRNGKIFYFDDSKCPLHSERLNYRVSSKCFNFEGEPIFELQNIEPEDVESIKDLNMTKDNTVIITASPLRIIDIYTDILNGWHLSKRGDREFLKGVIKNG